MSVASEIARLQNAKASIKTAIENKGVTVGDIKLDAYSAKIDEISAGVEPTGTLEITENGTYDVKQKAYAKVAVPEPSGNIKITENGFHIIKQYSIAEVAVYPTLIAKTISANGTYNASDDNAYGYGSVSVNIPEKTLGTKTINANGDYSATDDSLDGYSNVSVSVPEKTLTTKTITANGTYNANDDNADGYSQVTVETSGGVDINDYYNFKKRTFGNITYYIKTIPLIDTSSYTSMESFFNNYESLESIPLLDTRNVTNMRRMCDSCGNLKTFPAFDTSKVTNFYNTFHFCKNLREYPRLDFSSANSIQGIFDGCYRYVKFNGLKNLGQAYDTSSSANNSNYRLDISNGKDGDIILATNIDHDSLMNVINDLYDIASKGVATQQLVIGSTNLAKLTAEEVAIGTSKGWSIS